VKEKVEEKKGAYAALINSRENGGKEVNKVKYKAAKKIAKKVVTIVKKNACERLC